MAKQVKNTVKSEYTKQRRRIQSFIRRAEKRGYLFGDNVLPKIPKKITKASVRKLEKITPETLYKKALYGGEATDGEIVSGLEGLKAEKEANKQKRNRKSQTPSTPKLPPTELPWSTPWEPTGEYDAGQASFYALVVVTEWYNTLDVYRNGEAYGLLHSWMNQMVTDNGAEDAAEMLQKAGDNGTALTADIVYKNDLALWYISELTQLLPDQGVMYHDEVLSKFEFMSKASDAFEEYEDWSRPF